MLKRLKTFIDSPWVNFCGAVIAVLLEVVSWWTVQEWKHTTEVAFCLTIVFLSRLAWTQYWEAEEYRQRLRPKLNIVFDHHPQESADDRPFFQKLTFGMVPNGGGVMVEMLDRRYRVGVRNVSDAIIPKVRLILAKCEPSGNFVHIAHRLLVTDSDPPEGERDLAPSRNGSPTLWFDVVSECGPTSRLPSAFGFCYANPNIRGPVDGEEYRIVLRCEGGGTSDEMAFTIRKAWNDRRHESEAVVLEIADEQSALV